MHVDGVFTVCRCLFYFQPSKLISDSFRDDTVVFCVLLWETVYDFLNLIGYYQVVEVVCGPIENDQNYHLL